MQWKTSFYAGALACVCGVAVGATPTAVRIHAAAPSPSEFSQGIVVLAELDAPGTPGGSIVVGDGVDGCTAVLPQTWCLYRPTRAGTHTLVANYSGDVDLDPSTSAPVAHVVAAPGLPRRMTLGGPDAPAPFTPSSRGSGGPVLSADGRHVAFDASADLDGSGSAIGGIFVRDRKTRVVVRVAVGFDGSPANGTAHGASLSADGRVVAFYSGATNLVPDDTNGVNDVFVRDLDTGTTTRVSVGAAGVQGNALSQMPAISADGRYVAFASRASNLVAGDTNQTTDAFVHDRTTGQTTRVNVSTAGAEADWGVSIDVAPVISADGRYVGFDTQAINLDPGDTNRNYDSYVRDRVAGTTALVSVNTAGVVAETGGSISSISADGRYVAFASAGTNVVSGDTNGAADVFVRDLVAGVTERVSLDASGAQGNGYSRRAELSADGRRVAFVSRAPLVAGDTNAFDDIYVRDRDAGTTRCVSVRNGSAEAVGASDYPAISADGVHVAFVSLVADLVPNDLNGVVDVFAHDLDTSTTEPIGVYAYGNQANGPGSVGNRALSADGRHVAFVSSATNLVPNDTNGVDDVFVRDTDTGQITRVSVASGGGQADRASEGATISADGRYVAFLSLANNLVPDDTTSVTARDAFVHDRATGTTERVNVSASGVQANSGAGDSIALSADGRYVVFTSAANNLVDGVVRVCGTYVRDRTTGEMSCPATTSAGVPANAPASDPWMSADGRYVVFVSTATNLATVPTPGRSNVFVRDRTLGTTSLVSTLDGGVRSNSVNEYPRISADGRYVAFHSTWYPPDGGFGQPNSYLRDLVDGTTTKLSVDAAGGALGTGDSFGVHALSGDGRFVVFGSTSSAMVPGDTNGTSDLFVRDRVAGTIRRLNADRDGNVPAGAPGVPSISNDGHYVAFSSDATALVAGDTNGWRDVFLTGNPLAIAATTTQVIAVDPVTSVVGTAYAVDVAVAAGAAVPRGSVEIDDGAGATCTATLAQGTGRCTLTSTAAGERLLTARYVGEAGWQPSSATQLHVVSRAPTSTSLTGFAPSSPQAGETVRAMFSVGGGYVPGGNVVVTADSGETCTATLAAGACDLVFAAPGTYVVTAAYAGDANNGASSSTSATLVVAPNDRLFEDGFEAGVE
jgi:Tol biopolymer transport system component